eukprot:GHVU01225108.1.p4 GENE.GHVU01225108.1~~GHVU01225108.1.p4  ORF type:complete len:244 (-),score=69.18 GHVU01225108.1:278-1009(-)
MALNLSAPQRELKFSLSGEAARLQGELEAGCLSLRGNGSRELVAKLCSVERLKLHKLCVTDSSPAERGGFIESVVGSRICAAHVEFKGTGSSAVFSSDTGAVAAEGVKRLTIVDDKFDTHIAGNFRELEALLLRGRGASVAFANIVQSCRGSLKELVVDELDSFRFGSSSSSSSSSRQPTPISCPRLEVVHLDGAWSSAAFLEELALGCHESLRTLSLRESKEFVEAAAPFKLAKLENIELVG